MKSNKSPIYILLILLLTVVLGVAVFYTSQKLTQTTPVAPNVPQVQPKAANQACTVTFTMNTTNSPTPTSTGGPSNTPTPTNTGAPSNTPTPTNTGSPSNTPAPSNTPRPTATSTPVLSCNNSCTTSDTCQSGLSCVDGACRNPSCTNQTNCTCATPTQSVASGPTPTPRTPEIPVAGTGPTTLGIMLIAGASLLLLLGFVF